MLVATKQLIQNELYSAEIANDTLSQLKATIEVIQRIGGHQGNNMLEFMKIMRMQVHLSIEQANYALTIHS